MTEIEQYELNMKLANAVEVESVDTIFSLLKDGADLYTTNENQQTLLHIATENWDSEIMNLLLESGLKKKVNETDHNGNTPLHLAVQMEYKEHVHMLIAAGADLHVSNHLQQTLLHIAAYSSSGELLSLLLESGLKDKVNATNYNGETPLFCAVELDNIESARILVAAGADLYTTNEDRQTLLHAAAKGWKTHSEIMKYLLESGLREKVNEADCDGETPLFCAVSRNRPKLARLLIAAGADIHTTNEDRQTLLHAAVDSGANELLSFLLESGLKDKINVANCNGETPLHNALRYGNKKAARMLIAAGADLHTTNKDQQTLLHAAVDSEAGELLRPLLESGLQDKVNAADSDGNTPLHIALQHKNAKHARLLIAAGADLHTTNKKQQTLLHAAANDSTGEILKLLLKNGLQDAVNARDVYGKTPLHDAVTKNSVKAARILIAAGADLLTTNEKQETLLHTAVHDRNTSGELLSLLLARGLKEAVNATDLNGETALYTAVQRGHEEHARILIAAGADIHTTCENQETLLHAAVQGENREILKLLLDSGLEDAVNAADEDGETALMQAVSEQLYSIIRLLLAHGADVHAADAQGETALDRAATSPYLSARLQVWAQQ